MIHFNLAFQPLERILSFSFPQDDICSRSGQELRQIPLSCRQYRGKSLSRLLPVTSLTTCPPKILYLGRHLHSHRLVQRLLLLRNLREVMRLSRLLVEFDHIQIIQQRLHGISLKQAVVIHLLLDIGKVH